ncbi:hypothetical protein PPL_09371 [Heterostelium album PN500]|uniref:VOC domain-containing protein n=1 Tax=Heterostelium pallidum (strain ATCC 26659 / Pp 5 / PN500) TaxID=670386 RepID=D3BLD7_HETP5|nr:hypothetical protein PPL_09371 [Heterostelium album PN500]EFA77871.1 hypothetical protein PPL_09371 [Heterostelium album PN500]|eukprot:XP_020429999.1 hypothetical protein PPL_09371 [Heterostelium album PN500]
MKIFIATVFVDNQEKALDFYTNKLGFQKKADISAGDYRWLTVVSPDQPNGVQLLLEPNAHPATKPFQSALKADCIPFTQFEVEDLDKEFQRLKSLGVEFVVEPMDAGPVMIASFDDTCGNLIQIMQYKFKKQE